MPERGQGGAAVRPRVLVTGFSVFPGAPVNPTERLVGALLADDPSLFGEVLQVDYRTLPVRLAELGADIVPDITIHFGLSASAHGFTLESRAHNAVGTKPDNSGHLHPDRFIRQGGDPCDSTLPLAAIEARLRSLGVPVSRSDSAGDYLCNFLFYHAASAHFADFAPAMTGFIHVPPAGVGEGRLTAEQLLFGARAIVEVCRESWKRKAPPEAGLRQAAAR